MSQNNPIFQSKNELYFRRTNESAYFNTDGDLVFGIEGVCGNSDHEKTSVEKVADKAARIEKLLADGFVETKPKARYPRSIDDYYDEEVLETIVSDLEEDSNPKHLSIITWDSCFECDDNEELLEYLVENHDKYKDIEYFTFGDMDYEVCEISWIEQGNYTEFFKKYNHIKGFSVQGTMTFELPVLDLPNLEILEIEGSGLKEDVLVNLSKSKLPNLKKLNIWFGDSGYGCEVEGENVKAFFETADFPNLVSLGMCNIEHGVFSDVLKSIFESKYISKIRALDLSKSVSMANDAEFLIENLEKAKELKYIDMYYNYILEETAEKLKAHCEKLGIEIDLSEAEDVDEDDEDDEDFYSNPMYSE